MTRQYLRGLRLAAVMGLAVLLAACSTTVRNYGPDDHFSPREASRGSTSSPRDCEQVHDAVWVQAAGYQACIRYFPSSAFHQLPVKRAIVFMEGDVLDGRRVPARRYAKLTPRIEQRMAQLEQQRGGTPFVIVARPGTDGSSGDQGRRRTQYETLVMNAAIQAIKDKYRIQTFGLAGQSGGGGLVAALIEKRQDVMCAVSASGVTAPKFRAEEKGRQVDATGIPLSQVWDPSEHLADVRPMPGFRMFVVSDARDAEVDFPSQQHYVQLAQAAGLPVAQIMVRASGRVHHQTARVGNRVVEDCMLGLPTDHIVARYTHLGNHSDNMNRIAAQEMSLATGAPVVDAPLDTDSGFTW